MKRRLWGPTAGGVLASLLLSGLALSACGKGENAAPPPAAPPVSVATPLVEQVVDWDDFVGRFEAPHQVEVRARVGGYLQTASFREGQYVRKGKVLFTLDPRPAQAALAAAEAQAAQVQAALGLAQSELNRAQSLLSTQAVSQEEFETRRAAVVQQQTALRAAQANVRARQLDLEFTRVLAPISGVVSERRVDAGNLIAGGSSQADVLTTIVASDPIHFVFEASEAQLLKYQRQARAARPAAARVRLQDEADYRWSGTIDFSDNAVDTSSGAIRMRALIQNPGGFLKPGMFGHARVEGSGAYRAMLVPDASVITDAARKVVYVVGQDGAVQARPVQLGPLSGGLRVVREGLQPTDRVIVNGVLRARPGQKVTPSVTKIARTPAAEAAGQPVTTATPSSVATPVGALPAAR